MPFPSFNRSGPGLPTSTSDEQQRLLPQDNGVNSSSGGYSATSGDWSAPNEGSSTSGPDAKNDVVPPQSNPGTVDDSSTSPPFNRDDPTLNAQIDKPKNCYMSDVRSKGGSYLFVFILGVFIALIAQDMWAMTILSPSAIERRRLAWDRDYTEHLAQVSAMQDVTAKWAREIEQHASLHEAMLKERADWEKERAQERAQQEAERRKERADWEKGRAQERDQWEARRRKEHADWEKERAQERAQWEAERRKDLAEWDRKRAQWQAEQRERERLQEDRMKLELEKKRRELEREREEEEKKRAGLKWQDPQPDQFCLRYGTRRYTAKLENVPDGYNKMKACHETQAWIGGRWVTPSQCDDGGVWGGVHGTWIVDWDESPCRSYFQDFRDKGCTSEGSGKRRIESQIQNIQSGDDALKMCASTPADFHGLHFDAPHSCEFWRIYGVWGLWFIEDGSCA
ncbi:hypothetical protein EST38_g5588 [Candolleomyces aberdarensis]|uniref:Uncharacterized protein n=1 Tax=Candolleomyces aberdarensis TaxID=2316362 RepID=A0A4Q2DK35_9AGAR|nr:hypothetical protein EST38_g5588 [Candolleomyces aberdarensis]